MKRYRGYRDGTDTVGTLHVDVIDADGDRRPLRHTVRHSPTGMNCGYNGSGPSDLALSLLIDHLGESPTSVEATLRAGGLIQDEDDRQWYCGGRAWIDRTRASRLYHEFKHALVVDLPVDRDWEITSAQIDAWLSEQERSTTMFRCR